MICDQLHADINKTVWGRSGNVSNGAYIVAVLYILADVASGAGYHIAILILWCDRVVKLEKKNLPYVRIKLTATISYPNHADVRIPDINLEIFGCWSPWTKVYRFDPRICFSFSGRYHQFYWSRGQNEVGLSLAPFLFDYRGSLVCPSSNDNRVENTIKKLSRTTGTSRTLGKVGNLHSWLHN